MSDETMRAIEDAIQAHIQAEYADEPWIVTNWYAIACASNQSMDSTNYVHMSASAPLHISLGLIDLADIRIRKLIVED